MQSFPLKSMGQKLLLPLAMLFFGILLMLGWTMSTDSHGSQQDSEIQTIGKTESNNSAYLLRILGATGLVIVVIGVMSKGYRKYLGDPGQPEEIRVVSRKAIAPRQSVAIIEIDGRRLLIGCTDQQIRLLTELAENEMSVSTENRHEKAVFSFRDLLPAVGNRPQPVSAEDQVG